MSNTWANVLSDSTIQEVRLGYSHFDWKNQLAVPALANTPNYVFPSLTVGQRRNYPQEFYQNTWSAALRPDHEPRRARPQVRRRVPALARHRLVGAAVARRVHLHRHAGRRPAPLPGRRLERPDALGRDRPRLDRVALRPELRRLDDRHPAADAWRCGWATRGRSTTRSPSTAACAGTPTSARSIRRTSPPRSPSTRAPATTANTALSAPASSSIPATCATSTTSPRAAASPGTSAAQGNLVIRGGSGLYFSIPDSNTTFSHQSFNGERILVNSFPNDGQPGFIQDPTRGVTADDILAGRVPLPAQSPRVIASDYKMPYTWQSTIGFQTQFGARLGVEADLTHWKGYNFARQRDPNLFFNPLTGYNIAPTAATPAGSEVRQDPVARVDRQGRLRRDLERDHQALRRQLAGRADLHLHALHERQHHQLPVRGQQPLRPGCRVGALDRLPAAHPAHERPLAPALGLQHRPAPTSSARATTTPRPSARRRSAPCRHATAT